MNMGEEREGDLRVPLLSGLFFVSCLIGGIILTLWLFDAKGSQPWFPIFALVLIGFPWFFWALICCYSINKKCLTGGGGDGGGTHAISKHTNLETATNTDFGSCKNGPEIIVDNGEPSIASSDKESEMPLNRSAAS